ncbi:MAG: hypothetical protein R3182_08495, partial [Draconibacterium sp.]|nr:hypothetical protein [Draconibacterium sp.]
MKRRVLILYVLMVGFISCLQVEKDPTEIVPLEDKTMEQLVIPEDFKFETSNTVTVTISDFEPETKYAIYSRTSIAKPKIVITGTDTIIDIDNSNQLLAEGFVNGTWTVDVVVPGHQEYVYIKRLKPGAGYGENVSITGNRADFSYAGNKSAVTKSAQKVDKDIIYAISSYGLTYSFDPETGNPVELARLEGRSNVCAVNKADIVLYVAEYANPSTVRSIELTTGKQEIVGTLNRGFERMAYSDDEQLIYLGVSALLYSYDPVSDQYLTIYEEKKSDYNN